MSFWDYQPEEYEQFFLSKQEEAVKEALSTKDIKTCEYEISVELLQDPYKLSISILPNTKSSNIYAYVDSDGLPVLKEWMEGLSDYTSFPSKRIFVTGDGISFIISYTYLGCYDIAGQLEPLALIQYLGWDFIAMVANLGGNMPYTSFVVPIRGFLSDLYNGIIEEYSKIMSPGKNQHDGLRDQFYAIKSFKIENNLKRLENGIL